MCRICLLCAGYRRRVDRAVQTALLYHRRRYAPRVGLTRLARVTTRAYARYGLRCPARPPLNLPQRGRLKAQYPNWGKGPTPGIFASGGHACQHNMDISASAHKNSTTTASASRLPKLAYPQNSYTSTNNPAKMPKASPPPKRAAKPGKSQNASSTKKFFDALTAWRAGEITCAKAAESCGMTLSNFRYHANKNV